MLRSGYLIATVFLVLINLPVNARRNKPLIWDLQELERLNEDSLNYKDILYWADEYCNRPPVVVTQKNKTFAPDIHYYCSIGPYWWPDPQGGDKYINRDGLFNPEMKQYDFLKISDLSYRCQYLSKAFYLTRNRKYFNAFVTQLRSWFIDKDTYMLPSFMYSQVIPGQNDNMGRSTGMIDAYVFNDIVESIRLVHYYKRIGRKTYKKLQKWFATFADDSEERFGDTFRNANNNISLAYDVLLTNLYLFSGNEKKALSIFDSFAEKRINVQILADGSQPVELKRTRALFYSLYNLTHIIDFCFLVRYWDKDYYNKECARVEAALCYVQQYLDNKEAFPYEQISSWDECRDLYKLLIKKTNKLKE